jgi:hypothetical protein
MWVYEIEFTPTSALVGLTPSAQATAPVGTTFPDLVGFSSFPECISMPAGESGIRISCSGLPVGVDIFEPVFRIFPQITGRVGFNSTNIVCDSQILLGCPSTAAGSNNISSVVLNYEQGILEYVNICPGCDQGFVKLSPNGSSASLSRFVEWSGFWDFGNGGEWRSGSDSSVTYSARVHLVSEPAVIPLPAPALMLGSGFVALGALRARRRVRSGRVERSS